MTTARTKVHRAPHKQIFDPVVARGILERAIIAHVAICLDNQPYVLPVSCAPYGKELLLHGSPASRLFRALADGTPACVTVTLLDGLVLARSAFESSMQYQSLMALGSARLITDAEKLAALHAFTDHLFPDRRRELRESTDKELNATMIVAFPLTEISIKVSAAEPDDPDYDLGSPAWAGVLPISSIYGAPMPAKNLRAGIAVPEYISHWPKNRV